MILKLYVPKLQLVKFLNKENNHLIASTTPSDYHIAEISINSNDFNITNETGAGNIVCLEHKRQVIRAGIQDL